MPNNETNVEGSSRTMHPESSDNTLHNVSSQTTPKDTEDQSHGERKVSLRERVDQFTWAWFTCTQSTGGIAVILSETPNQFSGLQTIGVVVYIFNIVLFLAFIAILLTRWFLTPSKIKESFIKPPENFFYGSFWLSAATIIIGMQRFGVPHAGPWLTVVIRVCFWIYAACTLLSSTVHLAAIFQYTPIEVFSVSPAIFLTVFNAMLTGTVAGAIAADQPPEQRLPIIIAGVGYQGLGWIVSIFYLTYFIGNQLQNGWPENPSMRPGLFMPVGSSGFTIVALITNAAAVPDGYGYFATHPTAAEVVSIVATWVGVFMWVFTFWLFGLALCVNLASIFTKKDGRFKMNMGFTMSWWGECHISEFIVKSVLLTAM